MKKIILLLAIFNFGPTFSQSKKEQIDILTFRIDSLNLVIKSNNIEINNKDTIIWNLESQINTILENKELEVNKLRESLFNKDSEIQKKTN